MDKKAQHDEMMVQQSEIRTDIEEVDKKIG